MMFLTLFNNHVHFMKAINLGFLSTLIGGAIFSFTQPALSSELTSFSFVREYDSIPDDSILQIKLVAAEFTGADINEDGVIREDEIDWFKGTLVFNQDFDDSIDSTQEQVNISSWQYNLETEQLAFNLATLYRPGRGGFTGNSVWSVDSTNPIDSFLLADMSFSAIDSSFIQTINEKGLTPALTPESSPVLTLAFLSIYWLWTRKQAL